MKRTPDHYLSAVWQVLTEKCPPGTAPENGMSPNRVAKLTRITPANAKAALELLCTQGRATKGTFYGNSNKLPVTVYVSTPATN